MEGPPRGPEGACPALPAPQALLRRLNPILQGTREWGRSLQTPDGLPQAPQLSRTAQLPGGALQDSGRRNHEGGCEAWVRASGCPGGGPAPPCALSPGRLCEDGWACLPDAAQPRTAPRLLAQTQHKPRGGLGGTGCRRRGENRASPSPRREAWPHARPAEPGCPPLPTRAEPGHCGWPLRSLHRRHLGHGAPVPSRSHQLGWSVGPSHRRPSLHLLDSRARIHPPPPFTVGGRGLSQLVQNRRR